MVKVAVKTALDSTKGRVIVSWPDGNGNGNGNDDGDGDGGGLNREQLISDVDRPC